MGIEHCEASPVPTGCRVCGGALLMQRTVSVPLRMDLDGRVERDDTAVVWRIVCVRCAVVADAGGIYEDGRTYLEG